MRIQPLVMLTGIALVACDGGPGLPTPDAASAEVIISYPSGFVDTLDPTSIHMRLSEIVPAPGDTVRCLMSQVDGPSPPPPEEGGDLIVDLVMVDACGANFTKVPPSWGAPWNDSTTAISSLVRANTIGHSPDSGSVSVRRLGGGYAEMKFTLRYYPIGSVLPPDFRITGRIIAPDSSALEE